MVINRPVAADFMGFLKWKEESLISLYIDLREFVLGLYPEANELLYHTHALTSVYSISDKLGDAYCMIPVYTGHLNLGFNKGTLLPDPQGLLKGTGTLIRHIPVTAPKDYRNDAVAQLVMDSIAQAKADMVKPSRYTGDTFSKIKAK